MVSIKKLGVLDSGQLKGIYPGSHIEKQIPQSLWDSIVDSLKRNYPDWALFTQEVYSVEFPQFTLYLQETVISLVEGTGPAPIGCELFFEQNLDLTDTQYLELFENFAKETGIGCCFTTVYSPEVQSNKHIHNHSSIIEFDKGTDISAYLFKLKSKKRNSANKSLDACKGLTFKRLVEFTQDQTTWLHMTLLRNFAREGTTMENGCSVEYAQVQWTALLGSMKTADFYVVGAFNDQGQIVGAIGLARRIPIDNDHRKDVGVHYDFTSYVQDHSYKNIASGMLLHAVELLTDKWYQDVTVTLSTAPPPGTDYNYFMYKRNCSSNSIPVVSALAMNPNAERAYPNSFDSNTGTWNT